MSAESKLQWNTGGWLGGQLGGTVWILVAAVLTGLQDAFTGLLLFAVFAAPNVAGLALWRRRERLDCYPATQVMILLAGVFSLIAVYTLNNRGMWEEIQHGGVVSSRAIYLLIVLVVAVLMATFHVRFGRDSSA